MGQAHALFVYLDPVVGEQTDHLGDALRKFLVRARKEFEDQGLDVLAEGRILVLRIERQRRQLSLVHEPEPETEHPVVEGEKIAAAGERVCLEQIRQPRRNRGLRFLEDMRDVLYLVMAACDAMQYADMILRIRAVAETLEVIMEPLIEDAGRAEQEPFEDLNKVRMRACRHRIA